MLTGRQQLALSAGVILLGTGGVGLPHKALADTAVAGATLIIATGELPPYVSEDPKDAFLIELLHEVAREMGVRFEFRFMPWRRCEAAVEKLEAWGAIPYVRTPEREEKYFFSEKLFNRQAKFFYFSSGGVPKSISYTDLADLKDYRIGAVRGYYYEQALLRAGLRVEFVTTDEQSFRMLKAGKVDLIPCDDVVGFHIIQRRFSSGEAAHFFTLSKPLDASGDYLLTSKRFPDTQNLLTRFNRAMKKVKESGVYQKVLKKHGVVLTYD